MPRKPLSPHMAGIAMIVVTTFCFSIMNVLISDMSGQLASPQMVFLRNLIGLCMMVPIVLYHGLARLKTERLSRHFSRAFIGLVAMEGWFFSLTHVSVNEATALSFTSPLFATLFAVLLLSEKIGRYRVVALLVGFAGALIILRPDVDEAMNPYSLVVLLASAMMALAGVVVKTLAATDPPWRIVSYMAFFMTVLSAPLGIYHWQPVTSGQMLHLLGIAATSTLAQYLMAAAFARAPVALLMPFDFLRLVFTSVFAYFFLGDVLDGETFLGAAVICFSTVFITWREARLARKPKPESKQTML